MLKFEWDDSKNRENIKKHKINFSEAKSVFYDENARLIPDIEHSDEDERFILLGLSTKLNALVVIHCYRKNAETIRIISARKATKSEIKVYEGYLL